MFCKKCGRELKEGSVFCPDCGAKQTAAEAPERAKIVFDSPVSGISPVHPASTPKKQIPLEHWMIPAGISIVMIAAVIAVICLVSSKGKTQNDRVAEESETQENEAEENYTVAGAWELEDARPLGKALENIIVKELSDDLGKETAKQLGEAIGKALTELSGATEVYFRDNGTVEIYIKDFTVDDIIDLQYDLIDDSEMKLTMEVKLIPGKLKLLVGNIPSISYKSDYHVGRKQMTMDFFGKELELKRKK